MIEGISIRKIEDSIKILQDDHPLLRKTSAPVENFDGELLDLATRMLYAMVQHGGIGLSAVQIGEPVRVIIVRTEKEVLTMVNPVITRRLLRDDVRREGCLSVPPRKWKRIARPAKCEVEWQDVDGSPRRAGFSGQVARCVQHECDHLDGVLLTDLPTAP